MAKTSLKHSKNKTLINNALLVADLREMVQLGRRRVATVATSTQMMLYWRMGRRLLKEDLRGGRGDYGREILATVARALSAEFGDGFSYSSLTRMVRFAEIQPDEAIVATLSQQLGWSHVLALLPIKDPLARDFYAEMCRIERWDVRTLRKKIGGMLFQRTALSKNTKEVISAEIGQLREGRVTPEAVFRDPYFLDFLGLKGAYSERDLEAVRAANRSTEDASCLNMTRARSGPRGSEPATSTAAFKITDCDLESDT